jgi:glutamate-1-semialdehyde 2,1-aminomutase
MPGPDPVASWIAAERARYQERSPRSAALYVRACRVLPGGDTRHGVGLDPHPAYADQGVGTDLLDADGHRVLDLIYNATSLIHGHAHPRVVDAVIAQAARGTAAVAPNSVQIELAEQLCGRVGSLERLRFTNSGTEATMMMIKTARAFMRRDLVLKMDGAYHGSFDGMEFNAREPMSAQAAPYNAGVPENLADNVVVAPFNDADRCTELIREHADRMAAVIVTPVASVDSWTAPAPGFLAALRAATSSVGVLLLFDEVLCFRLDPGGAQGRYGVRPDLTAFGKIIGGGLPVGAFGGRADIMAITDSRRGPRLSHAGTFNGNPVTAMAGLATLNLLDDEAYARLEQLGAIFAEGLRAIVTDLSLPLTVNHVGSLVSMIRSADAPADWDRIDAAMPIALLNRDILGWHRFAMATVMGDADVDTALARIHDALAQPARLLSALSPAGA